MVSTKKFIPPGFDPHQRDTQIKSSSPYLARLMYRFPENVDTDPLKGEAVFSDIMRDLRLLKQRVALYTACRDLSGEWPLTDVTGYLSRFADIAMQAACQQTITEFIKSKQLHTETTMETSGLSIIALGKWGAGELNYSSDIDFMVLFDPDLMPVDDQYVAQNIAVRFTRRIIEILERNTSEGYVFRTDLRLRPDPGATQLAVSLKACEVYYGSLGQNWERAAMIKARPVCGDARITCPYVQLMQQWIWRRNLDFATIQDIVSIKNQIGAQDRGDVNTDISPTALYNLDVKRDPGGIREIELFVQIQQLIFGGRQPDLREIQTCDGLHALAGCGHIPQAMADELTTCYRLLRYIEHRLQMQNDRQTHALPTKEAEFERFAQFCGFENTAHFVTALQTCRMQVTQAFASLFTESETLTFGGKRLVFTGSHNDTGTLETIQNMGFKNPAHIADRIRKWHHAHYRATRTNRARQILTNITPRLLQSFANTQDPDLGFIRFDRFLEQQTTGVYLFTLLEYNPEILDTLALVFGTAPRLGEYFTRHPESLEVILMEDVTDNLPNAANLSDDLYNTLVDATALEERLEGLRQWAREQRTRAGLQIIKSTTNAEDTARFFSDVAEISTLATFADIRADFEQRHGAYPNSHVALLALGRFGGRQMTIGSDLDLIMVYDIDKEPEREASQSAGQYFGRLMQKLSTALDARMREGRLYKTDLRLRPHGEAGAFATKLTDFKSYYLNDAWLLESLSLLRARAIGPDSEFNARVDGEVSAILKSRRDPEILYREITTLQARTYAEHGRKSIWAVKYHRGGLMDIMLKLQYLCLRYAAVHDILPARNTLAAVKNLQSADLISDNMANTLRPALTLYHRIQGVLRLSGQHPTDSAHISPMLGNLLLKQFHGCAPEPPRTLAEAEACLQRLYDSIESLDFYS